MQGFGNAASEDASRSLWRNHDFTVLWAGQTVSTLGSAMSSFVFPIVGYAVTGSTTRAALALTSYTVGAIIFRLQAGALVDRWNRRLVMVACNGGGAAVFASLAVALLLGHLTLGHLLVAAFLSGLAGSFFGPAEAAAIRTVVPARQLPTAFSQNQARGHVASLVGPPLAGLLYSLSRAVPFLVDAVSYAISAVAICCLRTPLNAPPRSMDTPRTTLRHDIAEGLRFLMSRGFFRATIAWGAMANFGVSALFLVLTLKLLGSGVHPATIGLVDAIGATSGLLGSLAAPRLIRTVPTGRLAIGTALLVGLGCLPMAFTNNVVVVGFLLAVALFCNPAGNAAIGSYLVAVTPDALQGRVSAALTFCVSVVNPLGPVVGGVLLATLGGQSAILVTSVLIALSAAVLLASKETRELPTPDSWPVPEPVANAGASATTPSPVI
ncbi:MFS transporter [Oryzihumus sp.]|uniref:MFS transporter n=1 Tax=Oryzihumus sp. TaxID=1968903 RepID=UPI002ED87F21